MKIHKVLNNNVIISKDAENEDIIVTGKGIAFSKKAGDEIDSSVEYKVYTLNNETISQYQQVATQIPIEYIILSEKIIDYGKRVLGDNLNNSIYITLADHIYSASMRYNEGIELKSDLYFDIKRLYKKEFKVGTMALKKINETLDIALIEDEAAFIALHFVNAQLAEKTNNTQEITNFMKEILQIVKYHFNISFDEDSFSFGRFLTHLRYFSHRFFEGLEPEDKSENEMLEIMQKKYPAVAEAVEKIQQLIARKYQGILSENEKLYLMMHIYRIVKESC